LSADGWGAVCGPASVFCAMAGIASPNANKLTSEIRFICAIRRVLPGSNPPEASLGFCVTPALRLDVIGLAQV
jgi:hypothetical protein